MVENLLIHISFSPTSLCSVTSSVFCLSRVSESTVISIISSLDTKKASGADSISTRFIKAEPSSLGMLVIRLVLPLGFFLIYGSVQWLLQFRNLGTVLS